MGYSVVYEKINDGSLPDNYYYAFIPALDLTTHGLGLEGAKKAAQDLLDIWLTEKKANGETLPEEKEAYFSTLEIKHAF